MASLVDLMTSTSFLASRGASGWRDSRLALPFGFLSLQLQTLFCGFLLGAVGFLAIRYHAREAKVSFGVQAHL
jgi:hypothetical protein